MDDSIGAADSLGALVPGEQPDILEVAFGPLSGIGFVAKDNYDVAGFTTGAGNPDWARSHPPAESHAWAVRALLTKGARLIGKAITDEMAYSLIGRNGHFGTPANSNAPGRVPGGSSSGSAAAVAGGLCETALGSDTGGSVRVPASFCGLYGIRTTHGAVCKDGMVPMAPSFDCVGWFARDAATLGRVGAAMLPREEEPGDLDRMVVASDAMALALPAAQAALAPVVRRLKQLFAWEEQALAAPDRLDPGSLNAGSLEDWREASRHIQAVEFQRCHRGWIEANAPQFAPDIADRIAWALGLPQHAERDALPLRARARRRMEELTGRNGFICLPSAPDAAPPVDAGSRLLADWRQTLISLTCPASLSGLPQISLPFARVEGCPLGLSLIGPAGRDRALLSLAVRLERLILDV